MTADELYQWKLSQYQAQAQANSFHSGLGGLGSLGGLLGNIGGLGAAAAFTAPPKAPVTTVPVEVKAPLPVEAKSETIRMIDEVTAATERNHQEFVERLQARPK